MPQKYGHLNFSGGLTQKQGKSTFFLSQMTASVVSRHLGTENFHRNLHHVGCKRLYPQELWQLHLGHRHGRSHRAERIGRGFEPGGRRRVVVQGRQRAPCRLRAKPPSTAR